MSEPAAIPVSPCYRAGNLVFISGQIGSGGCHPLSEMDIEAQTEQTIKNIVAVLETQGLTIKNIVKNTVYLKNISDAAGMNRAYARFFAHKPSRTTVGAGDLAPDALLEIESVAYIA